MIIKALYACIFFSLFNLAIPVMGGTYIAGDLGASPDISYYGVSFFGLGAVCLYPLNPLFEKRLGKIECLLIFLSLFTFFTFCTAFATTFPLFIILRFISGMVSSVFFSFGFSLIRMLKKSCHEKEHLAPTAFLISISPALAASFGAWIAYDYDWKWMFLLQIPFLIATFCILYKFRTDLKTPLIHIPFDTVGYIAYLLFVTSIGSAVSLGQDLDWLRSPLISSLFGISLISFPFFVLWELKQEHPLIDLKLFRIPTFCMTVFSLFVLFSIDIGMTILFSLWIRLDVNYTPIWIAILLLHMVIAATLVFIFVIKWMERLHSFLPVIFAIIFFGMAFFYSSFFNAETNFERLAIARMLAGFGLAFFFFPLFKICLECVPVNKSSQGTAIFHTCRLLAGSLGIAFYNTLLLRREIFYHDRLGSYLTKSSEITDQCLANIGFFHKTGIAAKELLNGALNKQSTALGLADCFYCMGWVMTGLFIIVVLFSIKEWLRQKKYRLWS